MFDRAQLEAFYAVFQHGSFERAAIALNVTRSAVSQRIKALEEALATMLVVRGKPVVATCKGEILLRHIRALKTMEDDTISAILPTQQVRAPVPIAIAVNTDSLSTWFGPLVAQLLSPLKMALEIVSDDQDHTFHRLIKGEVMGCVSSEPDAVQGFKATPLGIMDYLCVATPEFKHQYFQNGMSIAAVLAAPAILFDRKDTLHDQYLAQLFGVKVTNYTCHYLPSPTALLDGICAGLGYAMAPGLRVAPLLETGQLTELTPSCRVSLPLYWHHWQLELPLAQTMTQTITAHARKTLDQPA
jgi:LysR family transcriptional regulator (chromosome initiation inhibitor)